MYDVAIIGAGPAGSTLARLLSDRYRVLIVDRRRLDRAPEAGFPIKTCGGLLAPAAQQELARQGLGVPGHVATGPQLFAVRADDADSGLQRLYTRSFVNVDRELMDRWLLSLVNPAVDRGLGWSARSIASADDGVLVRFETPGNGTASALARFVVGADGASSIVRRSCFASRPSAAGYVAVQGLFESTALEPHYGAFFDSALTDHYGWTVPKGSMTLVGAAFPRQPGVSGRYDAFVERVKRSGFGLGDELSRSGAAVCRPTAPAQLVLGSGRVVLIGEAAGLISPSSAEGISYALRSAAVLAEALAPELSGALARYRRLAAPLVLEVSAKIIKSRLISSPSTRRLLMRSGVGALAEGAPAGYGASLAELLSL
jgi:flavin-dependent dehydrogenase